MHGVRRAEVQLGDTACVIGLGLVGQLVVRLLIASGVRVIGLDVIEERCRLAEQAGAVLCAAPSGDGMDAVQRALDEITERARGRSRLPGRRRVVQRPGGDRRPARPRSRPRRGHRQDQAGPALERLLRQGTRRPVLPVVRSRAVRRALRARGHRLPDRLRALDRASQPRMLPRPHRAQGDRGRDARLRRLPVREREHRLCRSGLGLAQGRGRPARVPGPAPEADSPPRAAGSSMVRASTGALPARQGQRAAGDRVHRGRQLRVLDAAAAPRPAGEGRPRPRRDEPVAVRGQRAAALRVHHRVDQRQTPCSRTPPSTRSSS